MFCFDPYRDCITWLFGCFFFFFGYCYQITRINSTVYKVFATNKASFQKGISGVEVKPNNSGQIVIRVNSIYFYALF